MKIDQEKLKEYYEVMKSYTYRVVIEKDGSSFHGYVPALHGCHSFGKTIEETRLYVRDALQVYIESLIEDGKKVPTDTTKESLETISISLKPSYA